MNRKRVLIVDDEVGSSRLLKANLEMTDQYEVLVENHPEDALEAARTFHPHLVLLDVVMPHMSGYEVARVLRNDSELRSVPIALLSAANTTLVPLDPDPSLGYMPRISKPAPMEEILSVMNNSMSRFPAGLMA